MISIRAIRIDQHFNLSDGSVQNYLIVELPDGTELKAPLSEEQTEQVIRATVNGEEYNQPPAMRDRRHLEPQETEPSPVQMVGEQSDEQDEVNAQALFDNLTQEPATEDRLINWGQLSNETLTVMMKAAFKMLGAPPQMTFADVQKLANNIAEQFGPEDWSQVQQRLTTSKPKPAPRAVPPINQVQWADGSPMVAGTKPARTIPKDDMGNPIIDGEIDPGEVVAGTGDIDEDGVSSL